MELNIAASQAVAKPVIPDTGSTVGGKASKAAEKVAVLNVNEKPEAVNIEGSGSILITLSAYHPANVGAQLGSATLGKAASSSFQSCKASTAIIKFL